jgi:hypothetical protein
MIEVDPELLAFLKDEEQRSRNEDLQDRAEEALRAYNGDYYGDEIDGCSKVVSRDVAEVIDWMTPSVIRVFVSGDRVVEFEPDDPEQEQFADDATETIHRQFAANGYQLLHDWFKEGNISTLGIVKACYEKKRERIEAVVPTLALDHLPEGVEVIEANEPFVDEDGIEKVEAAALVDGQVEFKDYLIPLEEFRISPDARTPDEAVYIAHAAVKTLSELVEMGFDREEVEELQDDHPIDRITDARDGGLSWLANERQGATRRVVLFEEYVRFDADGDGIAERLCVHRVGNTVLRVEPCDYQPFVVYCPFPMPGRLAGHSLADKVTDIQRINTALNRLALDGLYRNLAPRTYVPIDCVTEDTYDDLLTVISGGLVRYRGPNAPTPEAKNDVSGVAWQAMEFMIGQRESRTGITRLNQGLDADALNKTARGTAMMQAAGQQMEEYLARNFGEAVARLMRLKLMLMSRYGSPMKLRVDGEYRDIDPTQWPESMGVSIRVGLGSGRKEQRLEYRRMVLEIQRECMMAGLPIVSPEHVYKSIQGVIRDAGLGSPNDFVADPAQMPPQEPQPDPEQQKIEVELELKAVELKGKQDLAAEALNAKREESALKIQLADAEAAAEADRAERKLQFEQYLAERQMDFEEQMEEKRLANEALRIQRDANRRDYETDMKHNRPGGDLDK